MCHLISQDHSDIQCQEPCERFCIARLHRCKLACFVECGDYCGEIVEKMLNCGHLTQTKCCTDTSNVNCAEIVEKTFAGCEHKAEVLCFSNACPRLCENQAPCGHSCDRRCHVNDDPDHMKYKCTKPCAKLMKNCSGDHPCNKECHEECDFCCVKVLI
jgi:hypothetical protein